MIGGHTFGLSLRNRFAEWQNRLVRARYFRGHGVHSPYVYSIVREVFMRRSLLPGDRSLYQLLCKIGVAQRRAIQLQNLAIHCGYATSGLNCAEAELCVLTTDLSRAEVLRLVAAAREQHHTVALLDPYCGCERLALCRQIVANHPATTIDNRAYLLIFNNYLPKQHFRI